MFDIQQAVKNLDQYCDLKFNEDKKRKRDWDRRWNNAKAAYDEIMDVLIKHNIPGKFIGKYFTRIWGVDSWEMKNYKKKIQPNQPMTLNEMEARCRGIHGYYKVHGLEAFLKDLDTIVENSILINGTEDEYTQAARNMRRKAKTMVQEKMELFSAFYDMDMYFDGLIFKINFQNNEKNIY